MFGHMIWAMLAALTIGGLVEAEGDGGGAMANYLRAVAAERGVGGGVVTGEAWAGTPDAILAAAEDGEDVGRAELTFAVTTKAATGFEAHLRAAADGDVTAADWGLDGSTFQTTLPELVVFESMRRTLVAEATLAVEHRIGPPPMALGVQPQDEVIEVPDVRGRPHAPRDVAFVSVVKLSEAEARAAALADARLLLAVGRDLRAAGIGVYVNHGLRWQASAADVLDLIDATDEERAGLEVGPLDAVALVRSEARHVMNSLPVLMRAAAGEDVTMAEVWAEYGQVQEVIVTVGGGPVLPEAYPTPGQYAAHGRAFLALAEEVEAAAAEGGIAAANAVDRARGGIVGGLLSPMRRVAERHAAVAARLGERAE